MDGFSAFFQRSTRLLPLAFLPLLVSCGVSGLTSSAKLDETSTVPTSASSSNLNPVGSPASTAAGFTIQLTNSNLTGYLHKTTTAYGSTQPTTNFSTACAVPYGTSGTAGDILCMLEIAELDLYFNDLTIQLNVPAGMCSYVGQRLYNFYAYQPGTGPTTVSYSEDYNGVISPGSNVDSTGTPHCTYNYSDSFYHSGSTFTGNCCTGSYTLSASKQATSTSSYVTTTTTGAWGGKTGACLTGPATSSAVGSAATQALSTAESLPEELVTKTIDSGLNIDITIPKMIGQTVDGAQLSSAVWSANYYDPANFTQTDSATGLKKPAGLTTQNGYTPDDTYTWNCYNTAEEIQSRIRLFIRKWNTETVAEGGSAEVTGTSTTYSNDPLDDYASWKDFATLLAGAEYPGADL